MCCSKCDFTGKTKEQMDKHMKVRHTTETPFNCDECDFCTVSNINLNWHKEAMHSRRTNQFNGQDNNKVDKLCPFLLNGFCRYSDQQCRYSHNNNNWCKFQMECKAWPNCRFIHSEGFSAPACYYQENCMKFNCPFEHYSRNDGHFLGRGQSVPEMNVNNFPPLNQTRNGQNNWAHL